MVNRAGNAFPPAGTCPTTWGRCHLVATTQTPGHNVFPETLFFFISLVFLPSHPKLRLFDLSQTKNVEYTL